jgi:hypothetical protein
VLFHLDPFESSEIQPGRYFGGCPSCLVTVMVSDFGRVIYLTGPAGASDLTCQ